MGRRHTKAKPLASATAGDPATTTTTSTVANALKIKQTLAGNFDQTIPDTFIKTFINSPGAFIVPDAEVRAAAMDVVGRTYDAANSSEKFGLFDDWNAVLNSGFDTNTQLWELINMRNEPVLKYSAEVMKELSQLIDSVGDSDSELSVESSDTESENDAEDVPGDQLVASSSDEEEESSEGDYAVIAAESPLDSGADLATEESDGLNSDEEDQNESHGSDEEKEDTDAKPSVVDDQFFSLAEMEEFADKAEEEEMRDRAILAGNYPARPTDEEEGESSDEDDDESIDLFQDAGGLRDLDNEEGDDDDEDIDMSDDDGKKADEMKYADFFKAPKGSKRDAGKESGSSRTKRVKFDQSALGSNEEDSESEFVSARGSNDDGSDSGSVHKSNLFDDDDDEENDSGSADKSAFEKRQEKLQGLIGKLEDEAVANKHWTMIGEVGSNLRPKNSLLNEDLDFDHMQKPVPVITQDATVTLEDVIKRRILNEEWDDVERKKDIQAKPFRPSAFIELNDKASKKSLAEEYEQEYMAQKAGDAFVAENDAKLAESHRNIDSQMRSLFTQLDALSHFHFAPKPATADIEIRTNAPALQMEEKLPVSVSQADQLAPGEIYEKKHTGAGRTGDILGDTELSREERKRRRQRKKHQAKKHDAKKTDSIKAATVPKAKAAA
ncbi:Mpp10 protein [Coemansia reversa NRRL 1564]|uniref:U3 small nucleolar ribonucleoprotein protein MPP10 n=1 Tax=Coemansia reversa (strain ATCC 12441 / NRRL 1564) TaxID=763665 RepID=A0A2G5BCN4_COERN|nr:Mpp10 protein [Coemansia reversa NRRL 1564]|eukprot:PIA16477.1 Mpp10 protein [Coemansia reversa NRRL 1564]